jgi:hypothetical protein
VKNGQEQGLLPACRHGTIACILEKAGTVSLKVVDISGRTVYRREFSAPAGVFSLKTAKLPLVPGIYCGMLTLPDGTKGNAVRFVK